MITPLETLQRAFPEIPDEEAQELISCGEVRSYPQRTVLCREDAYEAIFYIILDGKVQVTKAIASDQSRLLKTLDAGDFFGEMALIHDAPRAATVTALTPVTVLEIRKDAFNKLLHTSASLSRALVQEVSRRLRENDAMAIEDLRLKAGELATAYQQLAEQEYNRREFLTTIAHELRTPLTAANGYLQMIEKGVQQGQSLDGELLKSALNSAARNLQQIITLVNDLLFIQEMDLILLRLEATDIGQVLKPAAESCKTKIQELNLTINFEIPVDLPPVFGDFKSLERAFYAILDNAVKFSREGGSVEVYTGQAENQVWVQIQDHGVGIPEDIQPFIFDRFFHIDQIEGRIFRGVGLGLSIARQVIEQHHGAILIESKLGLGTKVTIYLPKSDQAWMIL
jgi:signal transduction histidine kinase